MHSFRPPARMLRHPDGRTWQGSVDGVRLRLTIGTMDGEVIERSRPCADGAAADRELAALIAEQLADGFEEISVPRWRAFVDELVAYWQADDPSFDGAALRDQLLAQTSPPPAEIVEHVIELGDHWIAGRDGSAGLDMDHALDRRHQRWLEGHGPASLPALLLALRHHDHTGQLAVEAILSALRPPAALPALLSVLEHPAPNLAYHLGGRPQHIPSHTLARLGPFAADVAARLIAALDAEDVRTANAAASVLAEHATDDRLFDALLARQEHARRSEGLAFALMRAAEVRRDPALRPFLEWMQRSSKFRSAGYPERIRAALEGLWRPPRPPAPA